MEKAATNNLSPAPSGDPDLAQRYLEQVRILKMDIDYISERILELQTQASSLASSSLCIDGKVQTSSRQEAPFVSPLTEIELLEQELQESSSRLESLKAQAENIIKSHTSGRESTVLLWYYIHGMSWKYVAYRCRLTERQIYRLKKSGLARIILPVDAIWLQSPSA